MVETKEKVEWKVEGMTCSNCALTISKYLQKEGLKDVSVNLIDGDVSFENGENGENDKKEKIKNGITLSARFSPSNQSAKKQRGKGKNVT